MSAGRSIAAANPFVEDFAAHAAKLPGAGLKWLDDRRHGAIEIVRSKGIPHRRVEEWKYSDLQSALRDTRAPVEYTEWLTINLPEEVEDIDFFNLSANTPDWVSRYLGTLDSQHHAMSAASLALLDNGGAYRVPAGVKVHNPVQIGSLSEGHARILIVLEEGAEMTVVETHDMSGVENTEVGGGFYNIGTEIFLAPRAKLTHVRTAPRSDSAVEVEEIMVSVAEGAEYRGHYINFGAKLSRVDVNVVLTGEGAEAHLSGVDVVTGATHSDITTHMDHSFGNTTSTQLFKKVAGGKAKSIYQGKVTVRPGANGSDSRQTAKGLLLSERAEIDLKPELEIFADDVKCAHGAAVGDLDTDSLFYLRARGVPEAEARNMLVHAFVADALDGVANETIRAEVWAKIEAALLQAGAA